MKTIGHPIDQRRGASETKYFELNAWNFFEQATYQCRVLLCPEPDGGFSAHALRLPGVVSEGETLEEATQNIADAFRGAIAAYGDMSKEIPWQSIDMQAPKGSIEKWILVDA